MAGTPSSAVVCYFKVSSTIKRRKKKIVKQINGSHTQGFSFGKTECSKYQLIFATTEKVLSKPFLFWLRKKNCLTVSLMGSKCVCLCRKAVLPVFYLTHFDWISAHFRKCSDAHIIRGCFACKQLLRAEIFSLFPRPLPPSSTPTPNQTWTGSDKRSRA